MKKTVNYRIDLGNTRIAGFMLYDPSTKEFIETTPSEVMKLLKTTEGVNGLKVWDDEIVLDNDGFNQRNLKIKSAVGKFRNMYSCSYGESKFYSLVRMIDTDSGRLYEVIDNKCARTKINAQRLRILNEFTHVAGICIVADNIEACDGVDYEDRRTYLYDEDLENLVNDEFVDYEGKLVKLSDLKSISVSTISMNESTDCIKDDQNDSINEVEDSLENSCNGQNTCLSNKACEGNNNELVVEFCEGTDKCVAESASRVKRAKTKKAAISTKTEL